MDKKFNTYKDIKSFEKACSHLSIDMSQFNFNLEGLTNGEIALRKLKIIVKAIRLFTNWEPNWTNDRQSKHMIWVDLKKGFNCWITRDYVVSSNIPIALFVENNDQAKFLGKKFLKLFKDYILEKD